MAKSVGATVCPLHEGCLYLGVSIMVEHVHVGLCRHLHTSQEVNVLGLVHVLADKLPKLS